MAVTVPYVEMRDAFGVMYRITTRSRLLLEEWFHEWLPELYPADAPAEMGDPLIMSVYPLPLSPDGRDYDWATNMRYITQPFSIPRDPAVAIEALDARRKWIEAQP